MTPQPLPTEDGKSYCAEWEGEDMDDEVDAEWARMVREFMTTKPAPVSKERLLGRIRTRKISECIRCHKPVRYSKYIGKLRQHNL